MVDMGAMVAACRTRVREARRIADRCRSDEAVHRLAMNAVFALEDTLFALETIAADTAAGGRRTHGDAARRDARERGA